MFNHVVLGSNNIDRAQRFYDAVFGVLGCESQSRNDVLHRLYYWRQGALLMITKPIDGQPATPANGGTIGFLVESAEQADAWRQAGVEGGGVPCEDPPGPRESPTGRRYVAFLRDPDGNKLCAVCRLPT